MHILLVISRSVRYHYLMFMILVCGKRTVPASSVGPYIVNGDIALPGAWPWQVAIFKQGQFMCGGSILSEQWILTTRPIALSPLRKYVFSENSTIFYEFIQLIILPCLKLDYY